MLGVRGSEKLGTWLIAGVGSNCWFPVFGFGPGILGVTGVNFLRNCLLRSVTRPLPSTLTLYLLNPKSSITMPVLSHFLAILPAPCWFCIMTLEPGDKGRRSLVWADHLSSPLTKRFLIANSLFSLSSIHTSEGEKSPGLTGKKSRIGRPNTI